MGSGSIRHSAAAQARIIGNVKDEWTIITTSRPLLTICNALLSANLSPGGMIMTSGLPCKFKASFFFPCFFLLFSVVFFNSTTPLSAQENDSLKLSQKELATTFHLTSKFRFGPDIKVGDWVKYQIVKGEEEPKVAQEIELEVTGEENGAFWIVETIINPEKGTSSETHILTDPGGQNVQQIFTVDQSGEKQQLPVLELVEYYTIFSEMAKKIVEQNQMLLFDWLKAEENEQIELAAGSFTCEYLKPDTGEEEEEEDELEAAVKEKTGSMLGLDNLKSLVEKPEDLSDVLDIADRVETVTSLDGIKGMFEAPSLSDAEDIANLLISSRFSGEEQRQTFHPLYFSDQVPRLIPYFIALQFLILNDSIKEISGGLVKYGPIELSASSGK